MCVCGGGVLLQKKARQTASFAHILEAAGRAQLPTFPQTWSHAHAQNFFPSRLFAGGRLLSARGCAVLRLETLLGRSFRDNAEERNGGMRALLALIGLWQMQWVETWDDKGKRPESVTRVLWMFV